MAWRDRERLGEREGVGVRRFHNSGGERRTGREEEKDNGGLIDQYSI